MWLRRLLSGGGWRSALTWAAPRLRIETLWMALLLSGYVCRPRLRVPTPCTFDVRASHAADAAPWWAAPAAPALHALIGPAAAVVLQCTDVFYHTDARIPPWSIAAVLVPAVLARWGGWAERICGGSGRIVTSAQFLALLAVARLSSPQGGVRLRFALAAGAAARYIRWSAAAAGGGALAAASPGTHGREALVARRLLNALAVTLVCLVSAHTAALYSAYVWRVRRYAPQAALPARYRRTEAPGALRRAADAAAWRWLSWLAPLDERGVARKLALSCYSAPFRAPAAAPLDAPRADGDAAVAAVLREVFEPLPGCGAEFLALGLIVRAYLRAPSPLRMYLDDVAFHSAGWHLAPPDGWSGATATPLPYYELRDGERRPVLLQMPLADCPVRAEVWRTPPTAPEDASPVVRWHYEIGRWRSYRLPSPRRGPDRAEEREGPGGDRGEDDADRGAKSGSGDEGDSKRGREGGSGGGGGATDASVAVRRRVHGNAQWLAEALPGLFGRNYDPEAAGRFSVPVSAPHRLCGKCPQPPVRALFPLTKPPVGNTALLLTFAVRYLIPCSLTGRGGFALVPQLPARCAPADAGGCDGRAPCLVRAHPRATVPAEFAPFEDLTVLTL